MKPGQGTAPPEAGIVDEPPDTPARILASWDANAAAWTACVRGGHIESRRVATDAAILDAVRALAPRRVLDVGCGEGWLVRALGATGIDATGVDGAAPLIDDAAAADRARYHHLDYAALAADPTTFGRFDTAVCNFSLFERELAPLLRALHDLLEVPGTLVIQTVHPDTPPHGGTADGWRLERFALPGEGFREAMPWYFRTRRSWHDALAGAGFAAVRDVDVRDPRSGDPLALLLEARRTR